MHEKVVVQNRLVTSGVGLQSVMPFAIWWNAVLEIGDLIALPLIELRVESELISLQQCLLP